MKKVFTSIVFSLLCFGLLYAQSFTDSRDGKTYKTVIIGDQTWMAENLIYNTDSGSWCYDNNSSNCDKYGRLYDWQTAQNVCPNGWHLPSKNEFETLFGFSYIEDTSGVVICTFLADAYDVFSTQLGGWSYGDRGGFDGVDFVGMWWSSSEDEDGFTWGLRLHSIYVAAGVEKMFNWPGYSIRCIKD